MFECGGWKNCLPYKFQPIRNCLSVHSNWMIQSEKYAFDEKNVQRHPVAKETLA